MILMEKLESFTDYISSEKITEALVKKLGIHLCLALEECERLSVIHRDIKPSNILVDKEENFLLADFGQAKVLERSAGSLSVQGTDSFIAPEVNNRMRYDHRADIYSLGIVLYKFLNNRRLPFLDPSGNSVGPIGYKRQIDLAISRRLDGEPLPPPCDASEKMAAIILKACSYAPEDRFQTAKAFRTALETGELPPVSMEEQLCDDVPAAPEKALGKDRHAIRIILLLLLTVFILAAA